MEKDFLLSIQLIDSLEHDASGATETTFFFYYCKFCNPSQVNFFFHQDMSGYIELMGKSSSDEIPCAGKVYNFYLKKRVGELNRTVSPG